MIRLTKVWNGTDHVWQYSLVVSSTVALATETYVQNAIANIDIPEGGGVKNVFIDAPTIMTRNEDVPEELVSIFEQYLSGENRNYCFYFKTSSGDSQYKQVVSVYFGDDAMTLYLAADYNEGNQSVKRIHVIFGDATRWRGYTDSYAVVSEDYLQRLEARIAALEGGTN